MKIHPISRAAMMKDVAVYGVLFLFLDLMVWLALGDFAQSLAVGLTVFIAVGFLVASFRSLSVPDKCWVMITPDQISWRTQTSHA